MILSQIDHSFVSSSVKSLMQNFTTTFSVEDTPRSGYFSSKTGEIQILVLSTIAVQTKESNRCLPSCCLDRRLQFCDAMEYLIATQPIYLFW